METSPQPVKVERKYNQLAIWSFFLGPLALAIPLLALWLARDALADTAVALIIYSYLCSIPVVIACLITAIISQVQIKREKQAHPGQAVYKGTWMADIGLAFGILELGYLLTILVQILIYT